MSLGLEQLRKLKKTANALISQTSEREEMARPWQSFDGRSSVRTFTANEALKKAQEIMAENKKKIGSLHREFNLMRAKLPIREEEKAVLIAREKYLDRLHFSKAKLGKENSFWESIKSYFSMRP